MIWGGGWGVACTRQRRVKQLRLPGHDTAARISPPPCCRVLLLCVAVALLIGQAAVVVSTAVLRGVRCPCVPPDARPRQHRCRNTARGTFNHTRRPPR